MAGPSTSPKTPAAAQGVTVPAQNASPVAQAAAGDLVFLNVVKASQPPHSKYPLQRPVYVVCRINYATGAPELHSLWYDPRVGAATEVFATKQPLGTATSIDIWGHGPALAAFVTRDGGLGRITFDRAKIGSAKALDITVEIMASVVQFIVDEMNRNEHDPELEQCKELNKKKPDELVPVLIDGKPIYLGNMEMKAEAWKYAGAIVARRFHAAGFLIDLYLGSGSDWDHKPLIKEVWGTWNRLDDSNNVYYYDIWSNIHYGYIGKAGGFSLERLHDGANQAQHVDTGAAEETADYDSVEAGFALYNPGRDITVEEVFFLVQRRTDWLQDARKTIWKKIEQEEQEKQRNKIEERMGRRGL